MPHPIRDRRRAPGPDTAQEPWTFVFTVIAAIAAVFAVWLMIKLRSQLTYVSFRNWMAQRVNGQILVRGWLFVQPTAGGYMITDLEARPGLVALLPQWLGSWGGVQAFLLDRSGQRLTVDGNGSIASQRAGTTFFLLEFPSHRWPWHLFAVRVTLVEGRRIIKKALVRVPPIAEALLAA